MNIYHLGRKVPEMLFEPSPISLQPHRWGHGVPERIPMVVPVGLGLTPAVWALRSPPCRPALTRSLSTGVSVHVCNEQRYGYLNVPVQSHQGLEDERVNFIHLILEALGEAASWCCPSSPSLPAPPMGPFSLAPDLAGQESELESTSPSYHSLTPGKSLSLLSLSLPL